MRLRIRYRRWPRPALVLADTPRPDCASCLGDGGWPEDYGDHTGEYAGTEWAECGCWDPARAWTLLPLSHRPRWLRRRRSAPDPWASPEPPF